jgi:hypothetical protein
MTTDNNAPNLPFLRALKCAYKLHKAGLTPVEVSCYLDECKHQVASGVALPSASTPVSDILPATFHFGAGCYSAQYWQAAQDRLAGANK